LDPGHPHGRAVGRGAGREDVPRAMRAVAVDLDVGLHEEVPREAQGRRGGARPTPPAPAALAEPRAAVPHRFLAEEIRDLARELLELVGALRSLAVVAPVDELAGARLQALDRVDVLRRAHAALQRLDALRELRAHAQILLPVSFQ